MVWSRFDTGTLIANWVAFSLGLASGLAVLGAAGSLGEAACRIAGRRRPEGLLALGLGLGLLGLAGLGAGLLGLVGTPAPWLAPVAAVILGWCGRRALERTAGEGLRALRGLDGIDRWLLLAAVGGVALGLMNVELGWDSLMYHLRLTADWQIRHKVFDVRHHFCAVFPAGTEAIFLLARLLGGDLAVRVICFAIGLLFLLAVGRLASDLHAPPGPAMLLMGASPLVLVLMPNAYVDLGVALFGVLAAREGGRWARTGSTVSGILAGACAGAAMGTKYVGVLVLVGVVAAGIQRIRLAGAMVLGAILIVGPWLLRTWLWRGNPVAPYMAGWFGADPFVPPDLMPVPWARARVVGLLDGLLFGDAGGVRAPFQPMVAGLIPLVVIGASGPTARFALATLAAGLVLCPDLRFLLPAVAIFAVVAASRLDRFGVRLIRVGAVLGILQAARVIWVYQNPLSLPLGLQSVRGKALYSMYPVPFHQYLVSAIETRVPRTDRILYASHFNSYPVERECVNDLHFGRLQLARLLDGAETPEALARALRRMGIGWMVGTDRLVRQYFSRPVTFDLPESRWWVFKSFLATRTEAVWQTDGLCVYRISANHAPRPLPALPVGDAIGFRGVDDLTASGKPAEALQMLRASPPLLADLGSRFVREGELAEILGRPAEVVTAFRRALATGTDTPSVHGGLALALLRLGKAAEALPHAERAWALHPLSANAAATLAVALGAVGRRSEAVARAREAVALRPDKNEYKELGRQLSTQ